jgi:hypothetical protein
MISNQVTRGKLPAALVIATCLSCRSNLVKQSKAVAPFYEDQGRPVGWKSDKAKRLGGCQARIPTAIPG